MTAFFILGGEAIERIEQEAMSNDRRIHFVREGVYGYLFSA